MSDYLDNQGQGNHDDELHVGLKILSFCIPLAGAIIYFTTDANQFPNKRKQACTFALIGVGVGLVLNVVSVLITGSM